jgi:hypothetical protein
MALTLVTNPVGSGTVKLFPGFRPVEFVFKREDLAITSVESGSGGIQINVGTDLTSYLEVGDTIYVYSEGADYTYNVNGTILSLTATDITIDIPYVQDATGGYINYLKNYYVELQCVDRVFPTSQVLPFSLTSDGDADGNISIDVSVANDLNRQREAITEGHLINSRKEFEIQYRQVYQGSSENFTLIDNKAVVLIYATEEPINDEILNTFDVPKLYLGYSAQLVIAHEEDSVNSTMKMTYRELDANRVVVDTGALTELDSDVNGFLAWEWPSDAVVSLATKFIEFDFDLNALAEYDHNDYASTDYITD